MEAGKEGKKKKEGGRETEDDTGRWGVAALTLSSTFKWDFSQTQATGKSNPQPVDLHTIHCESVAGMSCRVLTVACLLLVHCLVA